MEHVTQTPARDTLASSDNLFFMESPKIAFQTKLFAQPNFRPFKHLKPETAGIDCCFSLSRGGNNKLQSKTEIHCICFIEPKPRLLDSFQKREIRNLQSIVIFFNLHQYL